MPEEQKKIATNDLKKGDRVMLRCGWEAVIADNMKGNTRMATVYGFCTEMGSVYSHDIMYKMNTDGSRTMIEHTTNQKKVKAMSASIFG
jgi:hypothetical protein